VTEEEETMGKPLYSSFYIGQDPSPSPSEEEEETSHTLSNSTMRFRAICVEAPHTLPSLRLDLSEEEEARLSKPARAALARLKALWAEDE
jgi:hypothetical protein